VPWRIEVRPVAVKSLKRLSRTDRRRILEAIDLLPDGDVRKLRGVEAVWRLRVGNWRVLFSIDYSQRMVESPPRRFPNRTAWVTSVRACDDVDDQHDHIVRLALLTNAYSGHAETVAASIGSQSCR
jgi:mRNA interferase RelE/StbE